MTRRRKGGRCARRDEVGAYDDGDQRSRNRPHEEGSRVQKDEGGVGVSNLLSSLAAVRQDVVAFTTTGISVAGMLSGMLAFATVASGQNGRIEKLESDLGTAQTKITELTAIASGLKGRTGKLGSELGSAQAEITDVTAVVSGQNGRIEKFESYLRTAQAKIAETYGLPDETEHGP